jgi:hypothetical protein
LCNQVTSAIAAVVVTGNVEHPDGGVLCRACAALSPADRKARRDEAMARMLLAGAIVRRSAQGD